MRTHATFRSTRFDRGDAGVAGLGALRGEAGTDTRPSDAPPGADLIDWLRDALAAMPGLQVEPALREEYGWAVTVHAGEQAVAVHAGPMTGRAATWLVVLRPLVWARSGSGWSGRMDQHGLGQIIEQVHDLLRRAPDIHDVGWHEKVAFDRGVLTPSPTPFTPPPSEPA